MGGDAWNEALQLGKESKRDRIHAWSFCADGGGKDNRVKRNRHHHEFDSAKFRLRRARRSSFARIAVDARELAIVDFPTCEVPPTRMTRKDGGSFFMVAFAAMITRPVQAST